MNLRKKIIIQMKEKVREEDNIFFYFSTIYYYQVCYINHGDNMKKIIRSVFVPVFIAIILGYIGGRFVYTTYKDNLYDTLRSSRLYLVENGEYDNILDMREENSGNSYVYYKDDNKYKSVVGITKDYDNIGKIKSLYDNNLSVIEYYVANDILDSKQDEYEKKLNSASDILEVKEAVDNILNLYRSDESIKLISIN